ncbi:MAG TPA: DUF29 family protein [Acetobacteraceae bacterium]|nr:DUF29 family protein [Acetobacteraceae bacterium]
MSDLYDTEILLWSGEQAGRRRAAGTLVNESELDWPNIAEKIESVGSERRHAVESLPLQALLHGLKAEAWPLSRGVPHWRSEARLLRAQACRRFVPSIRRRLDPAGFYHDAVKALPEMVDDQPPLPVPEVCPITLDELLAED